ncbi:peptidoglycan-binding domain-containing protein [Paracoccus rhizosphaerae]|uniref:Peptidoglycan-binding protein n=1 Tax=Paracoccus rhizosphaerae TaxID=1133347 RepID=A0ABV6CLL9_9RHOB|nr:peptidoglycan-binding protein [Paracoccus rhizosphaerae]
MVQRVHLSLVLASLISVSSHQAHADPDLGEVVGTIARTVLEQQQAAHERALWEGVVANGSSAAYRQYLDTYPQGPNAKDARDRLARLEADRAAENRAAQAEAQLGLTQADRVAIQQRLAAGGYYKAGIDGVFGAGTRRAIQAWQDANALEDTGYLNAQQQRVLLNRTQAAPAPAAPVANVPDTSAAQAELNLGLTRAQRVQIQRDLTTLGYDPKGVDGLFGAGTRQAIRAWQRNTGQRATGFVTAAQVSSLHADAEARDPATEENQAAAINEDLLGLTQTERVKIQQRLISLGYLTGRADGIFGPTTRNAISRWQGDNGLDETSYLTAEQVRTLQAQTRI